MENFLLLRRRRLFRKRVTRLQNLISFVFVLVFCVCSQALFAQQTVTGRVSVGDTALSGATVQVKGSTKATRTDATGRFSISAPADATLIVSYIGYSSQEVKISHRTTIDIRLQSSAQAMGEVVVVGYGSVRRTDLTGSVATVSSEKINQVKGVSNVAQALQGQAAGVQVFQRSGQPGEGVSIKVRGTNSIQASNDVLYVVDGLPLDGLSAQLNPSDIESIDVLKDASSTAIYGSRGANGVVLITTKKGRDGKLKVSYNGYYGVQKLRKKMDLINAREFANLQNEAWSNWNVDNPTQPQKTLWSNSQVDSLAAQATDWQDLVYQTAPMQNHDISLSGGNAGTKYYSSFGYFDQQGIIPNSGFKRFSFRTNLDQKITERLSALVTLSIQQSIYKQNNYFNNDGGGGVPFTTMVMPPTQGIYDASGKYTVFTGVPWGQSNPYAISHEEQRSNPQLRIIGNTLLTYNIFNGLKFKTSFGVDNNWNRSEYYAPRSLSLYNNGGASQSYGTALSFINENYLNYNKSFDKHTVDAIAGITYQSFKSQNLSSGTASNFLTDVYGPNNLGAAGTRGNPGSGYVDNKLLSYYGRLNYSFSSRYFLTFTGRYDGSSKFSKNYKYAFFPSGAIGWRVSEENFMKNIRSISNLKLRGSYGLAGNQAISEYATLARLNNQTVILDNNQVVGYWSGLPSDYLKWETTQQLDLGIDLGLFNNRIEIVADYYSKKTRDLLLNVSVPSSTGFLNTLANVGKVGNKGIDLQLTTRNFVGKFSWTSTLTYSHNVTKVLDLGKDAEGKPVTYKEVGTGGNWFPIVLGQSLMQLYGYKVLGVYQTDQEAVANGEPTKKAGDYKFQTTPGGVLPNDNRQILSHFAPKFTYGFNNNFKYQNWNLSVLIVGSYGNDIANEFRKYNITLNGKWTPTREAYEGRWQSGKTGATFERPQWDRAGSSVRDYANSLWLEDGSYLRFRDITLGYDLAPSLLKAIKISSIQLYVSAQNLITITKYSGYDPEVQNTNAAILGWDRGNYPSTKSFTGGVRVNF